MVLSGLIRPPPEIRAVADRTALYVAKNGRAFEQRILNSAKGKTPKFAFLQPTSPFHAYYEDKVQVYINNGGVEEKENDKKETDDKKNETETETETDAKKKTATAAATEQTTAKAVSVVDPVAKALLDQRAIIKASQSSSSAVAKEEGDDAATSSTIVTPPPTLQWINIVAPSTLSVEQLETIQLTAQFVALDAVARQSQQPSSTNQQSFLQQLSTREWNNAAFFFMQPRHGLFPFFTALVDAYRHILQAWTTMSQEGTANLSPDIVKKANALSNNVSKCLQEAAYRAEYERWQDQQRQKEGGGATVSPSAVVDWHDFVVVETIDFDVNEVVASMPPPPPTTTTSTAAKPSDTMDESDGEEDDEELIRVVPSYTPKVVASAKQTVETVIDPISGKSIPIQDMPEHMRIQLLDPKWAEERKKFQEKQKDSNLVSGDAVAMNLARMAQAKSGNMVRVIGEILLHRTSGKEKGLSLIVACCMAFSQDSTGSDTRKRPLDSSHPGVEGGVGPALPAPAPAPVAQQLPPTLPPPPPPPPAGPGPAAKRPRVDMAITTVQAPPSMSHAATPTTGYAPMTETATTVGEDATSADPFAAGAAGVAATSAPAELLSAEDFAANLDKPEVTLQIRIPNDPTQMAWNFYGQVLSQTADIHSTIKTIKQTLSKTHLNDMPINKIQLRLPSGKFLNNNNATLAELNIGPTANLELQPKTRGGRK